MNPFVKKWLEALRSGKYRQGRSRLRVYHHEGDRFCCLGVACDIYNPSKWKHGNAYDYYEYIDRISILPNKLLELTGMNRSFERYLIKLNDDGKLFAEIANVIEQWYNKD